MDREVDCDVDWDWKNGRPVMSVTKKLEAALDLLRETADRGISEDWEVRRDELLEEV